MSAFSGVDGLDGSPAPLSLLLPPETPPKQSSSSIFGSKYESITSAASDKSEDLVPCELDKTLSQHDHCPSKKGILSAKKKRTATTKSSMAATKFKTYDSDSSLSFINESQSLTKKRSKSMSTSVVKQNKKKMKTPLRPKKPGPILLVIISKRGPTFSKTEVLYMVKLSYNASANAVNSNNKKSDTFWGEVH